MIPALSYAPTLAAAPVAAPPSEATPLVWGITLAGMLALLVLDFLLTRRPHEVGMKEALGWSAFYLALPLAFGAWVWQGFGASRGVEFYTGFLVEKSLSVDNLFVFMLLLSAFAVPQVLQQRVLLIGIAGALVLRAVFIAAGAALIASFAWAFLLFGAILLVTAVKVWRDAGSHDDAVDIESMKAVNLLRRFWPVTSTYDGTRLTVREGGRRALTPLALVIVAILSTDIVFAVDSVPAVYGVTDDPYLVFTTNVFALLGLRALYFVLQGALARLVHLGYGLAFILAFISVKMILHWAHDVWPSVPTVPTLASLAVIVLTLVVVTVTSLRATRDSEGADGTADDETTDAATSRRRDAGVQVRASRNA